jgi:hypothetical protein
MLNEKERLGKLLEEKIISVNDYKTLLTALDKKPSRVKLLLSFLVNPFQKIAGFTALLLGLVVILSMSYLGLITKIYFTSAVTLATTTDFAHAKFTQTFLLFLCQNLVIWLTVSTLFMVAAKVLKAKKTRMIDFFGTCFLSRFPYLFFLIIISVIILIHPTSLHSANADLVGQDYYPVHMSLLNWVTNMVYVAFLFWQIATYFYAFKESSGLASKKLVISFIIALVLGDVITTFLVSMLI